MKTGRLLIILFMVSISMRIRPTDRGHRVLVILYSELVRRMELVSHYRGLPGNPQNRK